MDEYKFRASVDRWIDPTTVHLLVDLGFRIYVHQTVRLVRAHVKGDRRDDARKLVQELCPTGAPVRLQTLYEADGEWFGEVWPDGNPQSVSDALITSEMA